eukprot:COSAG06_NODE_7_length_38054_cov_37.302569_8_plen_470_part_00
MTTGSGVVNNPLAAEGDAENLSNGGEDNGAVTHKHIDIKARLEDGTLTSDEAIVLMEEQMEAREKQLRAEMKGQMQEMIVAAQLGVSGSESTIASVVRGVVARLTETPTNFHQTTVFFLATDAPEDAAMARWAPLLYAGSLAMVLLQTATAFGVIVGTIRQACATNYQCGAGTYCAVGELNRCDFCGGRDYRPVVGGNIGNLTHVAEVCTMPYAERVASSGNVVPNSTVASWCEACVRNDGTVDLLTEGTLWTNNLDAMGTFDSIALVFASCIVAFIVVGELKDIQLCSIAIAHADDRLTKGWWLALGFLLWMRRWVFLVVLVGNVPALVLNKGGDALSVCLNTVAILFMCDIDNIFFDLVLGERVRVRVEDAGRVELGVAEALALARTKLVHVALLMLTVCSLIWLPEGEEHVAMLQIPWGAFLLGGMLDAFVVPGASAAETAKRAGKVLVTSLLGLCAIVVLIILDS